MMDGYLRTRYLLIYRGGLPPLQLKAQLPAQRASICATLGRYYLPTPKLVAGALSRRRYASRTTDK